MRNLRIAAAILAAFASLPVKASEDNCLVPAAMVDQVREKYPDSTVHLRFSGADASRYMDRFNEIPPVSDVTADEIVILKSPSYPQSYLVAMFMDGCIVGTASIQRNLSDHIYRGVVHLSGGPV